MIKDRSTKAVAVEVCRVFEKARLIVMRKTKEKKKMFHILAGLFYCVQTFNVRPNSSNKSTKL
jgi:hypothetical protein